MWRLEVKKGLIFTSIIKTDGTSNLLPSVGAVGMYIPSITLTSTVTKLTYV